MILIHFTSQSAHKDVALLGQNRLLGRASSWKVSLLGQKIVGQEDPLKDEVSLSGQKIFEFAS